MHQLAGLPRVEELFEARKPKGKAEISRIDGVVEVIRSEAGTVVEVTHREVYEVELDLPIDASVTAREGDLLEAGQLIGTSATQGDLTASVKGLLVKSKEGLVIRAEDVVPASRYPIPHNAKLLVKSGDKVRAGDPLTDGPLDPQELLEVRGRAEVQNYLVKEVQKVYRSQGVTISDKHIEIIVRQLLRKVRVDNPGDTRLLPTELADRLAFERENARVLAEGGEPATAQPQLLGVTKASLNTESFLAAASFQETTRVLTEAAITGARDRLVGLKENVIIGKLIPAGTGAPDAVAKRKAEEKLRAAAALAGGELPADFGQDDFNVFLQTEEAAGPQDDVSQLVRVPQTRLPHARRPRSSVPRPPWPEATCQPTSARTTSMSSSSPKRVERARTTSPSWWPSSPRRSRKPRAKPRQTPSWRTPPRPRRATRGEPKGEAQPSRKGGALTPFVLDCYAPPSVHKGHNRPDITPVVESNREGARVQRAYD